MPSLNESEVNNSPKQIAEKDKTGRHTQRTKVSAGQGEWRKGRRSTPPQRQRGEADQGMGNKAKQNQQSDDNLAAADISKQAREGVTLGEVSATTLNQNVSFSPARQSSPLVIASAASDSDALVLSACLILCMSVCFFLYLSVYYLSIYIYVPVFLFISPYLSVCLYPPPLSLSLRLV